ncbi:MAG TPA: FAD-dependent oxidoreductase, partial [Armatimonadetes bacterium]|nr:FAD-dependent oxidoreductase [Armatimonadota bacterium]
MLTAHQLRADVVVVGGGMAGVCAAIAAARTGAQVVLIHDRPMLGGNASSEIRVHISGADCAGNRHNVDARESGILEEIRLEDAVRNPQRSFSMFDLLLWEWVKREPNITLMLNTSCIGAQMAAPDRIRAVQALRHSTEDLFFIQGKMFIDCTGDGCLGAEANAEYRMGREGKAEYDESLAPDEPDLHTLGSSILFMTRRYDHPMPFRAPDWIYHFPRCDDLPFRNHDQFQWGFWWVEWGGELNTIKDNETIRDELLRIALGVWDHIKNSGSHPESENWALEWIGFIPAKRESRRLLGDYVLRQQDLQRAEQFEDAVAYGGWPIDLHPPSGIFSSEPPCTQVWLDELYSIPLRALYSRNVDNLLMAGRNISATHVAFASTRVMGTASVMGQAAGTAAALCATYNIPPRTIVREGVNELQQQLLKDDAYIIGVTNSDPYDVARTAHVRASSEIPQGRAINVINGI